MKSWTSYINDYKSYLKIERGLSDNSITNYLFDIKRLVKYMDNNEIDVSPVHINEEVIQKFIYDTAA